MRRVSNQSSDIPDTFCAKLVRATSGMDAFSVWYTDLTKCRDLRDHKTANIFLASDKLRGSTSILQSTNISDFPLANMFAAVFMNKKAVSCARSLIA